MSENTAEILSQYQQSYNQFNEFNARCKQYMKLATTTKKNS